MLSVYNFNNHHNNIQFKAKSKKNNTVMHNPKSTAIYRTKNVSYFYFCPDILQEEPDKNIISSTFRDEELFDDKRDYVTSGYRYYDEDDIKPLRQFKDIVDSDYRMARESGLTSKIPEEKTVYNTENLQNVSDNAFCLNNHKNPFRSILFDKCTQPETRKKIIEACLITNNGEKKLSQILTDSYVDKNSRYSVNEIVDIFNVAKLKKVNGDTVVDEVALSKAYEALNRYPSNNNDKMKTLINLSKTKNSDGDEVFSKYRYETANNLLLDKKEKFEDLPLLMDTVVAKSGNIDYDSYDFLNKLRKRPMPLKMAADITNACKLKNESGRNKQSSELQKIATRTMLKKLYKPDTTAIVINNLKVDNPYGGEIISSYALRLLNHLVTTHKKDNVIIKYTSYCIDNDSSGLRTFNCKRGRRIYRDL